MLLQVILFILLIAAVSLLSDLRARPEDWSATGRRIRLGLYTVASLVGGGIILQVGLVTPVSALLLLPVLGLSVWQFMRILYSYHPHRAFVRLVSVALVAGMLAFSHVVPREVVRVFSVAYLLGQPSPWQESINPDAEYRVRV